MYIYLYSKPHIPSRGVAEVSRNVVVKLIVIKEDSRENVHIKQFLRHWTGESVEPYIQEREFCSAKDLFWKVAGEFVVAKVKLVEESEIRDEFRDGACEVVGVCMEVSDIRQLVDEPI